MIGAAGGAGFAVGAPALANTAFFANFGVSGTIGAYTITGAAAGGAVGYGSGFTGVCFIVMAIGGILISLVCLEHRLG